MAIINTSESKHGENYEANVEVRNADDSTLSELVCYGFIRDIDLMNRGVQIIPTIPSFA